MQRPISRLALLLLGGVACRTPIPRQEILPEPAPVIATAASAAPATPGTPIVVAPSGPWGWSPSRDRRAWMVTQRATVTTRDDRSVRVDTVSSTLATSFMEFAQTSRISGSITSYQVSAGVRPATTPAGLTMPIALAVNAGTITSPAEGGACPSVAWGIAQGVRDLWMRPPSQLNVGSRWRDSVSYTICRDAIPLLVRQVREFVVRAAPAVDGRAHLTIVREARTTITGEGQQFNESVRFSGSGSGTLEYDVDAARSELLAGAGTSTLELTMQSRLRTQRVQQAATLILARAP